MSNDQAATLTACGEDSFLLSGSLCFDSIPSLHQIAAKLLTGSNITIDLAGVDYSDSAGIALLLNWLRRAQQEARELCFINPSEQMQTMAKICDLTSILGFN